MESALYEQALTFFDEAILLQPSEIKWHLMKASCLRRTGMSQKALEAYRHTHKLFPTDAECMSE